jgi:hypothetical protein
VDRDRTYTLGRIGGRRRAVVDGGGGALCVCAWLGPGAGAVDLLGAEGPPLATVRGGTFAVRDYHARMADGERLRVLGGPERFRVESDRRAATEVLAGPGPGGSAALTWLRDGSTEGVLRHFPGDGAADWTLEVPSRGDPVRALAVLLAAERLLREVSSPDQAAR